MTCPKLGQVTKRSTLTFPKSIVTSSFLDFHGFRKREREGERVNFLQRRLVIHFISQLLHPELLRIKEYRKRSLWTN